MSDKRTEPPLSFVVDTLADQNGDDYSPGSRSLREAILLANSHPGLDTITFSPALTAAGPGTISLKYGEMAMTEAVTITGPGANLVTIDAGQKSRIFNIDSPSVTSLTFDTSISGLTLMGGKTTGNNTTSGGGPNHYLFSGGAIHSFSTGALTLNDVAVLNSSTTGTGATGGGIFALGPIALAHSVVSGNSTTGSAASGGGIAAAFSLNGAVSASIVLTDSTVAGNQVSGGTISAVVYPAGGGIWSYGKVTLTRDDDFREQYDLRPDLPLGRCGRWWSVFAQGPSDRNRQPRRRKYCGGHGTRRRNSCFRWCDDHRQHDLGQPSGDGRRRMGKWGDRDG